MDDNCNVNKLTKGNVIKDNEIIEKEDKYNSCCEIEYVSCCDFDDLNNDNDSDCCCGPVEVDNFSSCCGLNKSFPDISKVDNPLNSKDKITDDFLKEFEDFTKNFDIVNVSYTNDISKFYLHEKLDFSGAIVLTIEMDQKILDENAGEKAQEYNDNVYETLGNNTYEISDFLRKNGYITKVAHPYEDIIDFSKLGQKANLGAVGKSGLLISPEFGPRQKISAILVNIKNLPISKVNEHLWIKEYCEYCGACIKKCPHNALFESKQTSTVKLNQNKCVGCSQGCTVCIQSCPFYKKGYLKVKENYNKLKIIKK